MWISTKWMLWNDFIPVGKPDIFTKVENSHSINKNYIIFSCFCLLVCFFVNNSLDQDSKLSVFMLSYGMLHQINSIYMRILFFLIMRLLVPYHINLYCPSSFRRPKQWFDVFQIEQILLWGWVIVTSGGGGTKWDTEVVIKEGGTRTDALLAWLENFNKVYGGMIN